MNTAHLVKKAQQRLFFLRKLKRAGLSPQLLTNFYRATIESILCLSAAVWYGSCTAQDRKDLARVVKTAQGIVGSPLSDLDSNYAGQMQKKARHIAADPTHPGKWTVQPATHFPDRLRLLVLLPDPSAALQTLSLSLPKALPAASPLILSPACPACCLPASPQLPLLCQSGVPVRPRTKDLSGT
ncbi:hypothetical protein L3Q82_013697 [Scortum barcoo]|uniref:Uncharacterized protein n=1 Tax=Scortum barcoo TaxID=214431 RepID=A0ACB8W194_9TELE|nr:hypothetical protein L3Q82_013697 [Scortum barcoo]